MKFIGFIIYGILGFLSSKAIGQTASPPVTTMASTVVQQATGIPPLPDVNCASESSVDAGGNTCFQNEGIYVPRRSFSYAGGTQKEGYLDALMANGKSLDVVCSDLVKYQRGFGCALEMARECLEPHGWQNYVPSGRKGQSMLADMCTKKDDINEQCVSGRMSALFTCVYYKATANPTSSVPTALCNAYKWMTECMKTELSSCGCQTVHLYVNYYKDYVNPSSCSTINVNAPVCVEDTTTVAPMTTMGPVIVSQATGIPPLPDVNCASQSSIDAGGDTCFQNEGIYIQRRVYHVGGRTQKEGFMDALMANGKSLDVVCRDLAKYQRGLGCALEMARDCLASQGLQNYVITGRKGQMLLADMCTKKYDIKEECVSTRMSALFTCVYNKAKSNPTSSVKTALCNAYKWTTECMKEELTSCGCQTTQLYVKYYKEYLNPTSCSPIYVSARPCVDDTDEFVSTGVCTVASVGLLALAALFAGWGIV